MNCIRQWVTNSLELLERLGADWPRLRQLFSPETDPGPLTHLGSEAGDRHRDGRTVAVLEFPPGLRLVYKPRAMALAMQFQALLAWINASRPDLPFGTTQILDCGTYGWMAFIAASPCASPQEVERFYQRQVCPSELLALRGPQEVNWLGLAMTSVRHGEVAPLDLDLYDGMPGVVLFLAYLGALSGVERYTALAHAACATMQRTVQNNRDYLTWIGGFVGWGGILYTLTHLAALWRQPQLLDEAQQIVELLPALIDQDEHLDVLSGAAGCIVALLRLHEAYPYQRTLAAAIQYGDRLIARAQPAGDGLCWPVRVLGPLAGFSHGAAGTAWALLALFARTREERFRTAARGGIAYEHSLFSAEAGNWRDLRDPEHMYFPTVWCHGVPGIGLARLAAVPLLQDDGIRADIATALQTTLTTGFGFSHSLCHGDLGNLELLLQSDEPSWRDTANRLAGAILDSARQHGWRCGTPMGVESAGV